SGTFVQTVIQPKATTDMKPNKKRILPSSKPKSSKQVRDVHPTKQVAETQPAEEIVATADTTKSLEAFESVEDQVNQPQTADAEKSMPDDDLVSLSGFEAKDTDEEGSQSNHVESVMTP
ncbi:hypothetical protein Tco_1535645, partial [Tanacetum coccineum]